MYSNKLITNNITYLNKTKELKNAEVVKTFHNTTIKDIKHVSKNAILNSVNHNST